MKKTQNVENLGEKVCADLERLHSRWMQWEKRLRKHRRRKLKDYLLNGGIIYEFYLEMRSYAALEDFLTSSLKGF